MDEPHETIAPPNLLAELQREAARIIDAELLHHDLRQVWTDGHRVRFRLADGRTGDVEVLVNWDVASDYSAAEGELGASPSTNSPRERSQSDLKTTAEAIEYCRVSRSQFFEWIRRGYLERIKIGRYVRFRKAALQDLLLRFERQEVRTPRHRRRMERNTPL